MHIYTYEIKKRVDVPYCFCMMVAQVGKNQLLVQEMQEMWIQSWDEEDPLEEETATHSSILAWEIPWTAEPVRLQSKASQRVRND